MNETLAVISVIIVNYNSGRLLRNCIDSLLSASLAVEIIVVDNASSDGSLDNLSQLPAVQIIKNLTNKGFSAACNKGLHASSAPFLLFLNPDCYFETDALKILLSIFGADSSKQIGMAGPFLANSDGSEQGGGRRTVPTPWRSFVRAFGLARFSNRWPRLFSDFYLLNQPLPTEAVEVEAISGACMLVKREAMQDVGEWDEGYFLHCEDLDMCMRFRKRGWKILFVPTARVTHFHGACSRSRPIFVLWHKHKGMMRFYHKFFRHQYPGVLMILVTIGVWVRFSGVATAILLKRAAQALRIKLV
jgi:GT2 family glycosyltransferase